MAANDNNDIIQEFLAETRENMDQMERDLMVWEKQPGDRETLDRIFRAVHTLKGTCGFLSFSKLEGIAHQAENLLSHVREQKRAVDPKVVTVLLQVLDAVRRNLSKIERTGSEDPQIFGSVLAELQTLQSETTETPANAVLELEEESPRATATENSLRVEVGLLDRLMNLVGELVLTRNQISQIGISEENPSLTSASQKLSHITSELQASIMKTRLQPIGNVWSKFPRLVRDAAMAGGKKIRIEMTGQQTELDKSIIEAIKDPLTHLIRNCIDHGIEIPERRMAAGKPEEGVIRLKAFHEGGLVLVEISDDGAGIRPELIREAALRRGLITTAKADVMTDHDLIQLIFVPGFSTAREVTMLSGRGVGMDVVKTNLERISGTIDVISTLGEGTQFKIKLPLTLAIIPALLVKSGGERFAIPQLSLLELIRLDGAKAEQKIEWIDDVPVYRLRGRLLPLVYLNEELKLAKRHEPGPEESVNIIVLESHNGPFGLIVDEVRDTEEIVVKPLGRQLKSLSVFAGATIMGDGGVVLILDVMGLAQKVRPGETVEQRQAQKRARAEEAATPVDTGENLLLFQLGDSSRWAVELSDVTRLEEFYAHEIERAGTVPVVQYRGQIMLLMPLQQLLMPTGERWQPEFSADKLQVIVHSRNGVCYGLLVDRIIDIAREPLVLQRQKSSVGVLGSIVIQRQVTQIIDIETLVKLGTVAEEIDGIRKN
ncbi:MAG: chemotaxis protein CheA [Methylacidiphilales bacterium]|nr:chemotaxis protein CheA [Candidatus Methylacidiphilales bacterium]